MRELLGGAFDILFALVLDDGEDRTLVSLCPKDRPENICVKSCSTEAASSVGAPISPGALFAPLRPSPG